uniref:Uncharacterized protein n=1 Tax=Solanum tuberosum TaxID=4113 RepID=M1DXV9_SOLTU
MILGLRTMDPDHKPWSSLRSVGMAMVLGPQTLRGRLTMDHTYGIWIDEQSKDTNGQKVTKQIEEVKNGEPEDRQ